MKGFPRTMVNHHCPYANDLGGGHLQDLVWFPPAAGSECHRRGSALWSEPGPLFLTSEALKHHVAPPAPWAWPATGTPCTFANLPVLDAPCHLPLDLPASSMGRHCSLEVRVLLHLWVGPCVLESDSPVCTASSGPLSHDQRHGRPGEPGYLLPQAQAKSPPACLTGLLGSTDPEC